jgi:hypothetical protein
MAFARFLHMLGQALWIGGGLAAMTLAISARGEHPAIRTAMYRLLGRVHGVVIAPGAALTVLTGIWLSMGLAGSDRSQDLGKPGLATMQGAGLIAGILVLLVALPTANRLAMASVPDEKGQISPAFERLRKRQMIVSSAAGVLALLAMAGARLF